MTNFLIQKYTGVSGAGFTVKKEAYSVSVKMSRAVEMHAAQVHMGLRGADGARADPDDFNYDALVAATLLT